MARVSILMSCHGTGRWLPEALASIPWGAGVEVLVTSNGAENEAAVRAALESYPAVKRTYRVRTISLSESLNYMLTCATAPYIMRLDPDDKLPAGALEEMLDAAEATEPPCFVYGGYADFGGAARYLRSRPATLAEVRERPLGGYNVLVDTTAARSVGGWEEIGYEDWHFYIKLMRYTDATAVRLDRPTLLHRVRPDGRYAEFVKTNSARILALQETLA